MRKKQMLKEVLLELRSIHYHLDRMEVFYMMANGIKEDGKNGAWVQEKVKPKKA